MIVPLLSVCRGTVCIRVSKTISRFLLNFDTTSQGHSWGSAPQDASKSGAMAQFDIYVKAGSDGKSVGDCPFSQCVNMAAHLKIPHTRFRLIPVDFGNKSPEFLQLNPKGSVPVLVNTNTQEVIADSQLILKELQRLYPFPDLKLDHCGPAAAPCGKVFPAFAAFLKNSDRDQAEEKRSALQATLNEVDAYLKSGECSGPFLLGESLSGLDCSLLPKLRHVQVAGKHFRNFLIPSSMNALLAYIKAGEETAAFQQTVYPDQEIIKGWARHNIQKMD